MATGTGLPACAAIGPGTTLGGTSNTGKSVTAITSLATGTGHTRGRRAAPAAGPTGRAIGRALIAIGTPAAGRTGPAVAGTIGAAVSSGRAVVGEYEQNPARARCSRGTPGPVGTSATTVAAITAGLSGGEARRPGLAVTAIAAGTRGAAVAGVTAAADNPTAGTAVAAVAPVAAGIAIGARFPRVNPIGSTGARHPGPAVTATAAGAPQRQQPGAAAVTAATAGTTGRRRGQTSTAGTAVAHEQPADATGAAIDDRDPGTTDATMAEPAGRPAGTTVVAVSTVADRSAITADADSTAGARVRSPAVPIAQQQAAVGVLGRAVADEDPQNASRLPGTHRRGTR